MEKIFEIADLNEKVHFLGSIFELIENNDFFLKEHFSESRFLSLPGF